MKQLFFFLVLLLGQIQITAQDYEPLLKSGRSWTILAWEQGSITNYTSGWVYYLAGDTIYENTTYQQLRFRRILASEAPVFVPPFELKEEDYLVGLIREELLSKKVFFLDLSQFPTPSEQLIYDFDVAVGDTVSLDFIEGIPLVVQDIELVMLGSGEERRKINFEVLDNCEGDYYIEGIGGGQGLLFPVGPCFESFSNLMCVQESNVLLYEVPGILYEDYQDQACGLLLTNSKEIAPSEALNIYPNPLQDHLTIELGKQLSGKNSIAIIDAAGRMLLQQEWIEQATTIDLQHLMSGVYILRMDTDNYTISKKLIKL